MTKYGIDTERPFGQNLRACRVAAGLTQEQLAQRMGMKRQTPISQWEVSPTHLPEPDTIIRLASALGVAPWALLTNVWSPIERLRGYIIGDDDERVYYTAKAQAEVEAMDAAEAEREARRIAEAFYP